MKQITSIVILVTLLFESIVPRGIGFSQEFALGEVLSHYQEHRIESKDSMSFLEFLTLHYSSDSNHREKNPDRLPSLDGHCTPGFLFICPAFEEVLLPSIAKVFRHTSPSWYTNSYDFDFSQNLLQPPRA